MGRGPTKKYYNNMNDHFVKGSLTCLKPEVIKKQITTKFPLMLNIEPTNACNARCYYCPRDITTKYKGINYIDFNLYKSIIDQIGDNKLIMMNLHKDGEPLMYKKLPQMVHYAKEKDVSRIIHFNTNGILLDSDAAKGVLDAGVDDITVSIDAAYEDTYYRLKKRKGLKQLEEKVEHFIDLRNAKGASTFIRVKIMEFEGVSQNEIQLFNERWTGIADQVQVTGVHNWSGAIEDLEITDEQTNKRFPCALLWYLLAINSNGEVSICNVDWDYSGVVGDVKSQTIEEIWNGGKIKSFRRAQLDGIWNCPDVCDKCVVGVSVGDLWKFLKSKTEFI